MYYAPPPRYEPTPYSPYRGGFDVSTSPPQQYHQPPPTTTSSETTTATTRKREEESSSVPSLPSVHTTVLPNDDLNQMPPALSARRDVSDCSCKSPPRGEKRKSPPCGSKMSYMNISDGAIAEEAIASPTKKLKSCTKAKSAVGDVIEIEISDDEGDDSQKEKDARYTTIRTRSDRANNTNHFTTSSRKTRSSSRAKSADDDVTENKLHLVYPFDVDEELLREASRGLLELGGNLLGVLQSLEDQPDDEDDVTGGTRMPPRTHNVIIWDEDYDRLSPGQFLNDTLVDFWMRWISRGESQLPSSDVHFFTSHFMTNLKKNGPDAVLSWTEKKDINIFEKKLIFIPVNADLHWSLLVVVNPGQIANVYNDDLPETEDHSFILFLDSLEMHDKHVYAKHIQQWLNSEHRRLGRGEVGGRIDPFMHDSIRLVSPKIPHQENGCDCGVFLCRYAYNLYLLRHQRFTWEGYKANFASLITNSPAFQFDKSEIARIRVEMTTLVDNLSKVYLPWSKEQELADRKVKRGCTDDDDPVMPKVTQVSGGELTRKCTRACTSMSSDADDDVTNEEEEEGNGEMWELSKIYTLNELNKLKPIMCSNEDCDLVACSRWESTVGGKPWNACLDCQAADFDGWPSRDEQELPIDHITKEHRRLIIEKCSDTDENPYPAMPDLPLVPDKVSETFRCEPHDYVYCCINVFQAINKYRFAKERTMYYGPEGSHNKWFYIYAIDPDTLNMLNFQPVGFSYVDPYFKKSDCPVKVHSCFKVNYDGDDVNNATFEKVYPK